MNLDPAQYVDRVIIGTGSWEPGIRALIGECVRPGEVCIDVGAHKGYFTCVMAKTVMPNGSVLSFDPDPRAYAALVENLARNKLENVHPFRMALGSEDRRLKLSLTKTLGNSSSFPNEIALPDVVDLIDVDCRRLDDVFYEVGDICSQPLSFIKMDAEGAEPYVWKGMAKVLEQHRPFIVLEVNFKSLRKSGIPARGLKALMDASGYTVVLEITEDEPVHLVPVDISQERDTYINVIAIHEQSPYFNRLNRLWS
jgi:FkbM family methyltransferase